MGSSVGRFEPLTRKPDVQAIMSHMERLRHGYTNVTTRAGPYVTKSYAGPDAGERQAREELALGWVGQWLPVPPVVASVPGATVTRYVPGDHGQELLETSLARDVMHTCGTLLKKLQALPMLPGSERAPGSVLVHGDFGPNNVLLTADAASPVLVVDWEWCGTGSPLTDLGWCEFVLREHHPGQIPALDALFEGYGQRPAWELRQEAMVERARRHLAFVKRWPGTKHVALWQERVLRMQQWRDV